jgi:uncharacterized membrane protein
LSSSFQTHTKTTKKTKRREGAPTLPSHFWLLLLPFCFKHFFLASSFSHAKEKRKKTKKKKTIEKKKNAKKGKSFPSSSRYALSLLALASTLPFMPFYFKCFFLASSFQVEENEEEKKKP